MIRVLQVVNDMHRAGLETMLMNYYRSIDKEEIQFDFLTHRPNKSDYDDEIIGLGGKVYYAPRLYPQNYPHYFRYMSEFFSKHTEYKIIHSHIDAMSYIPLLASKKAGVPIRIAHSHNTSIDKDFKFPLKYFFRKRITDVATDYCMCGEEAGKFLFPDKECTFIPNAIETNRFIFDVKLRERKRQELQIEEKFVIGHVGRLSYQKNHKRLIYIFNEVCKYEKNSILLLVGVGEKEKEIRNQVKSLGIENRVQFLGNRSDVNELYQAMDVFVMPSFFEGVPVVGIEAQYADLPCLFSDKVPKEVKFNSKCRFISLQLSDFEWAKEILKYNTVIIERGIHEEKWVNYQYDIRNAAYILENYYKNLFLKAEE